MRHQAGAARQRSLDGPVVQRVHRRSGARPLLGPPRRRLELLDRSDPDQLRREGWRAVRARRHLRPRQPPRLHDGVGSQRLVRHTPAVDEPHQLPDAIGRVRQRVPLRRQRPRHPRASQHQLQPGYRTIAAEFEAMPGNTIPADLARPRSVCRCSCQAARPSLSNARRRPRYRSSSRSTSHMCSTPVRSRSGDSDSADRRAR